MGETFAINLWDCVVPYELELRRYPCDCRRLAPLRVFRVLSLLNKDLYTGSVQDGKKSIPFITLLIQHGGLFINRLVTYLLTRLPGIFIPRYLHPGLQSVGPVEPNLREKTSNDRLTREILVFH